MSRPERRHDSGSSPTERFRALARAHATGTASAGTSRYLFGGLEVWLRPAPEEPDTTVELYWVGALRPGRGEGSTGMRGLIALADRAGAMLLLYADPWGRRGRMNRDLLRRWYERFGFEATGEGLVAYFPRRQGLEMRRVPSAPSARAEAAHPPSRGAAPAHV